jgi:glycosyltransferase involved in cell wall biosynthesis
MKEIWIFQTGEPIPGDNGSPRKMRAYNLADFFVKKGINVVIWTSRFNHLSKKHRNRQDTYESEGIKVKLIDSPGYSNNVSIRRLYDHLVLAFNLWRKLKQDSSKPSAVFIGYPPIEWSFIAFRWSNKMGITSFLDFKDLWPEIFLNAFGGKFKIILRSIFYPYFFLAKYVLKRTSVLISISEPCLLWAQNFSGRQNIYSDQVFPLSSKSAPNPENISLANKDFIKFICTGSEEAIVISFAGSFMTEVFDFMPLKKTIDDFRKNKVKIIFYLAGEGAEKDKWQKEFQEYEEVVFLGWINQDEINYLFAKSDAIIVPFKQRQDFALSIPNKAVDGFNHGKVILTSSHGMLSEFLEKNTAGFYYDIQDNPTLTEVILRIYSDNKLKKTMELNSRKVYEKHFEFEKNYNNLVEKILQSTG